MKKIKVFVELACGCERTREVDVEHEGEEEDVAYAEAADEAGQYSVRWEPVET